MNLNFFKSESKLAFPRCEHRSPSGRQCSQPVCTSDPRFCGTHKPTPEQLTTADLTEAAGTLSSPEEVHRFLKAVLLNRVRGRITPKEASVYSYLCQNLLRSLREIDHFQKLKSEREDRNRPCRPSNWNVPTGIRQDPPEIGWSLPRPDRSDPPEPAATEPVVVPSPAIATESPAATAAQVSTSSTISTASAAPPAASPSPKPPISILPPTPNPPFDPSHFYPLDPSLPRGAQDPARNIPPPDEAECRRLAARRGLDFKRRGPALPGALR